MKNEIIGRQKEQEILRNLYSSKEPELVAVIGRRRVGKTFLVKTVYADLIDFEATGIRDAEGKEQLQNFTLRLNETFHKGEPVLSPSNWLEAFHQLGAALDRLRKRKKRVIFLDELPWFDARKSGFLRGFSYFWNSWANNRNIVVVICGSAATWMIERVVNDTGGLHNRITKQIHLEPFTLGETEQYLKRRNNHFTRYQIAQIYMAVGGIPHYLKEIEPSQSVVQNIDRMCFSKQGILSDEFNRLYASLFSNAEKHIEVIRSLAQKRQGMTREAVAQASKIPNGGGLTKVLEELEQSGFIASYFPLGKKKKEKIFRLTDEYSLFYLQFIEQHRYQGGNIWQHLSQTPAYKTWSGYAFEGICMKHLDAIKQALGISGIYTFAASYHKKGTATEEGIQIDMLFDRNDHTINLFEIKFYNQPFTLTKEYADRLQAVLWQFQRETQTTKHVNWVFVSTFGLVQNQHSVGLVMKSLTLEDLF